MPGFLLDVSASLRCPHGGQIAISPGSQRVKASHQPAATTADDFQVTGCPFMVGPKPQPCVTVRWTAAASKVSAGGRELVLQDSAGTCLSADQVPAGPPQVVATQTRVKGT